MIVYGDPSFEAPVATLVERLGSRLRRAEEAARAGDVSLDQLRALLIKAGQLEQAAADAGLPAAGRLAAVTDGLASAFVVAEDVTGTREAGDVLREVGGARRAFESIGSAGGVAVRVKVPEGFAFYTLYPEQYRAAAERWVRQRAGSEVVRRAVVVGVRSIGTTLSAVVAVVLARAGWKVTRLTVRPTGHPYERRAALPPGIDVTQAEGLIVDEGPGHSGSSMAAVAQALAYAGMERGRISFLPGHGGEPGHAASDSVGAWWGTTPRYVAGLSDLRWDGQSLGEKLVEHSSGLIAGGAVMRVEDLGGGAWRGHIWEDSGRWPAAFGPFERTKYRCATEDGWAVLWKFAGLAVRADGHSGCESTVARLEKLAAGGWTPAPLCAALGFVATPWIKGRSLTSAGAEYDPAVLDHVARYVVAASPGGLDVDEQRVAFDRLAEMLYWNTRESLGDVAGDRANRLADAARALEPDGPVPAYGDGRLAPHEWLRAEDGRILKTDCTGHDADHTVVGRQPLAWDVAGAIVEWGLGGAAAARFLEAVGAAGTPVIEPVGLAFYRAAYAAFRVGLCSMCAAMTPDAADEVARLRAAESSYREQLSAVLGPDP